MITKAFLAMIVAVGLFLANAQTKGKTTQQAPKPMSYAKQKELSVLEIEGYKNSFVKLRDTTKKHSTSYTIFKKNEKLSNNFEVELVVTYGNCTSEPINGNLAKYKKNPASGALRGPKENVQPNTRDSSWVVTIEGKKVILNYYYAFLTNEEGEIRAKSSVSAYFDDGVRKITTTIAPMDYISKESGRTKIKTEAEFKSKLTTVAELEKEVTKGMQVFLKNMD